MLLFPRVVVLECLEDLALFLKNRTACKCQIQRGLKFISYLKYLKFRLYHVHDGDRRGLEIPGGLTLKLTIRYSLLHNLTSKNELTIVSYDERGNGRQLLCGDCTFNIESIPICVVGTSIHVTKVASDHIEVAVDQDDNSGLPKQREISRHCVSA